MDDSNEFELAFDGLDFSSLDCSDVDIFSVGAYNKFTKFVIMLMS